MKMKAYECDVCGKLYRGYHRNVDSYSCGKSIFGGPVNAIQFMDTDAINRVGGSANGSRKYLDLCPECLGAFTVTYLRCKRKGKESEEKGEE